MRLLILLGCIFVVSCNTARIRFVKMDRKWDEQSRTEIYESDDMAVVEVDAANQVYDLDQSFFLDSTIVEMESELNINDFEIPTESLLESTESSYEFIEPENEATAIEKFNQSQRYSYEHIESGYTLTIVALLLLITAFVLLLITLFTGIGLPFIYFFLSVFLGEFLDIRLFHTGSVAHHNHLYPL